MNQYVPGPAGYQYPQPNAAMNPAAHPSRGTATAALWCSILGFFCFPFLGSILGLVLARSATRNGYPGGRAAAARALGWIGLVLATLAVLWQGVSAVLG